MSRRDPRHGAFTLIELIIAIALGLVIMGVAVSGFRVLVSSLTVTQRIARTNDLLATAALAAFDEADFWDSYDDRGGDASGRRLRGSLALPVPNRDGSTVTLGLPFAPLSRSVGGDAATWPAGDSRSWGYGWQDDERLWATSADNELTWYPGIICESMETDCRFGHYSILGLSHLPGESSLPIDGGTSPLVGGWQPRNGGGLYGTLTFPSETTPPRPGAATAAYRHATPGWYYNQFHGLTNALGWYGMQDYLPANAILSYATKYQPMVRATSDAWQDSPADSTDAAGRPIYLIKTFARANAAWQFGDKPFFVLQSYSVNWMPHAMDFLTSYTAFGLTPPRGNLYEGGTGTTLTTAQLAYFNRNIVRMESDDMPLGDWGGNDSTDFAEPAYPGAADAYGATVFNSYVLRTTSASKLMTLKPSSWPDVSVAVARYLRLTRFSTQFKISWTDPLSGERADLRFTAMGTTLRGARRMRDLDLPAAAP